VFVLLAFSTALAGQAIKPGEVDLGKQSHEVIDVSREVTFIKEESLPLRLVSLDPDRPEGLASSDSGNAGRRTFAFEVLPDEKITYTLRVVPFNHIYMNWLIPEAGDPLTRNIKMMNLRQKKMMVSRLEFKNTLKEPYVIVLYLEGVYETPYSLSIKREIKK
jgi:hypothetical protein